jgi:hypothetical protein
MEVQRELEKLKPSNWAAQEIETRKSQAENKHHSLVIMKT